MACSLVAVIAACGDDGDVLVTPSVVPEAGDERAVVDGTSDAASPSPFGLDSRPVSATCRPPSRPTDSSIKVAFERVYANVAAYLNMGMVMAPGDKAHWFVPSLDGKIYRFLAESPPDAPEIAIDLKQHPTYPVVNGGECGLFGMAFHPRFAENGYVYVSYTTSGGPLDTRSIIARLRTVDGGATFGDLQPILGPFDQPSVNHNGGGIAFGPDGYLYVSFGDGKDPSGPAVGQRLDTFFSKVLRVDVDHGGPNGEPYAAPADNPFVGRAGAEPTTFAYGFRNPFRLSVDAPTGDVWVADVGESDWEEVDRVDPGGNYGWPCREGKHVYPFVGCGTKGFLDPIIDKGHTNDAGAAASRSITGGLVYRGAAIPSLVGAYVYGDFVQNEVWAMRRDATTGEPVVTQLNTDGPFGQWTAFTQDLDGEIYAINGYGGALYKLVPESAPPADPTPLLLSQTGCVGPTGALAAGLIPYGVNASEWLADGITIERALSLPDGTSLKLDATSGHLEVPIGGVLVQTMLSSASKRRIETRVLARYDDGAYRGLTYEWRADQSDAVLVRGGKRVVDAEVGAWTFPSAADCVGCHTEAGGRALGLELGQLARSFEYPGGRVAQQLATLEHIGVLAGDLGPITPMPDPRDEAAEISSRARAYLHVRCSSCHRPGSPSESLDLRFGATSMNGCRASSLDDLGLSAPDGGAPSIVAPGVPDASVLLRRLGAKGYARMPSLGTRSVDARGVALVSSWIGGLTACP